MKNFTEFAFLLFIYLSLSGERIAATMVLAQNKDNKEW
jgi:hypothetical protein